MLTNADIVDLTGFRHALHRQPEVSGRERETAARVASFLPAPDAVVALTGIAEVAGALCFIQAFAPHLHRLAGWVLAAYALCVWPANVQHMLIDLEKPDRGLGLAYHVPRMMLQPVLIWLALWAGKVIDWPFRR